jgi:hypothetical protein
MELNNRGKMKNHKINKDGTITIKTANGKTNLKPVFCEVLGVQIGWRSFNEREEQFMPAFVSLDAVDGYGIATTKIKEVIAEIDTF